MNRLKRPVLWAALIAIIVLATLSVYGAFLGADRAKAFFNSLPVGMYWITLIVLLIAGIALFRRLFRVPSLLLMHLGCIMILIGGIWGSAKGQAIQKKVFDVNVIPEGRLAIAENTQENRVFITDMNDVRELPFYIRAKDIRLEYYRIGTLQVQSSTGQTWSFRAEPGKAFDLNDKLGKITILKVFQNFKIDLSSGTPQDYDAPGGSNPAVRIRHEKPDGTATEHRVFALHAGHADQGTLRFAYYQMPRDYISELEVVQDGQVVAAKDIEVNHPLYYGGYHFYQSDYGVGDMGEYSVLSVVPDTGLNIVYVGYAMLIAGVFWHCWGRRALKALKNLQPVAVGGQTHGN